MNLKKVMNAVLIYIVVMWTVVLFASVVNAADKPTVIRFGNASIGTGGRPVSGGGGWVPIAAANGALEAEFAKDGIKVQYTYFSGAGPALNEALANGQIDLGYQGDLPALVAKAAGLKTKLILAAGRFGGGYLGVPADSSAQSIEDLRGKRIAIFKGTATQLSFYKFLAAKGLRESDFRIVNMSTYDANAALLSKDIDAQFTGTTLFPLVDRGVVRIIGSIAGNPKAASLSHVLVTEAFAARYPDIVQRVVNVFLKTAAWAADETNRTKALLIYAKSGIPFSAFKKEYEGGALRDRDSPLFDEFYRAHYRRQLKTARELKLVRGDVDIDTWLDPTYLNRALKELNLEGTWREFDADGNPKP